MTTNKQFKNQTKKSQNDIKTIVNHNAPQSNSAQNKAIQNRKIRLGIITQGLQTTPGNAFIGNWVNQNLDEVPTGITGAGVSVTCKESELLEVQVGRYFAAVAIPVPAEGVIRPTWRCIGIYQIGDLGLGDVFVCSNRITGPDHPWILALDNDGDFKWDYDGTNDDGNAVRGFNGRLYVATSDGVQKFTRSGVFVETFKSGTNITDLDLDTDGNMYIIYGITLEKLNSDGVSQWDEDITAFEARSVRFDEVNDNVVVAAITDQFGAPPFPIAEDDLWSYDSDGNFNWSINTGTFLGVTTSLGGINGLAIDGSGDIYCVPWEGVHLSPFPFDNHAWVAAKYNSSGVQQWIIESSWPQGPLPAILEYTKFGKCAIDSVNNYLVIAGFIKTGFASPIISLDTVDGSEIWVRNVGLSSTLPMTDVATDASGNSYFINLTTGIYKRKAIDGTGIWSSSIGLGAGPSPQTGIVVF